MASPPPDAFDPDAMLDEIEAELKAAPAPKPKAPAAPKAAPVAPAPKAPAAPKTAGATAAPAKPAAPPKAPPPPKDDDDLDERLAGAPPKAPPSPAAPAPPKPPPPAAPPVMPKGTAPQPAAGAVAPNASAVPTGWQGMRATRTGEIRPAPPRGVEAARQAGMASAKRVHDYEADVDAHLGWPDVPRPRVHVKPLQLGGLPVKTAPDPALADRWEAELAKQGMRRTVAPNRVGYEEGAAMLGMPPRAARPSASAEPTATAAPPPPAVTGPSAEEMAEAIGRTRGQVAQDVARAEELSAAIAWFTSENAPANARLTPATAAQFARKDPQAFVERYKALRTQ